jgi:glucose-1-phosphate thymidylyltransferase
MKGILLAGGSGTRLLPMTACVNKHLLPIFDKPMVFYPLATLMQAGCRDILLISTPRDIGAFKDLLGDGSSLGIRLTYAVQEKPGGIAEAFLIGETFVAGQPCMLILGDNIFHGAEFEKSVEHACRTNKGATVFAKEVKDPERFGIVEFDTSGQAVLLAEKPKHPRSNWAVTGLYIYDPRVCSIAKSMKPSARGELEITDVNRAYLEQNALQVEKLSSATAWLDTGTPESLLAAANYIGDAQRSTNKKIADLEMIAASRGYIAAKKAV